MKKTVFCLDVNLSWSRWQFVMPRLRQSAMKFYNWEKVDFGKGWRKVNSIETSTPEEVIDWLVDKCTELETEIDMHTTTIMFRDRIIDVSRNRIKELKELTKQLTQDKIELEITVKHRDYSLLVAEKQINGLTADNVHTV